MFHDVLWKISTCFSFRRSRAVLAANSIYTCFGISVYFRIIIAFLSVTLLTQIYIYIYIYIYELRSVYLSSNLLFKQDLLRTMECCLFIILNFIFSKFLFIFPVLGTWWYWDCPISFTQDLSAILFVVIRGRVFLSWRPDFYYFDNL